MKQTLLRLNPGVGSLLQKIIFANMEFQSTKAASLLRKEPALSGNGRARKKLACPERSSDSSDGRSSPEDSCVSFQTKHSQTTHKPPITAREIRTQRASAPSCSKSGSSRLSCVSTDVQLFQSAKRQLSSPSVCPFLHDRPEPQSAPSRLPFHNHRRPIPSFHKTENVLTERLSFPA